MVKNIESKNNNIWLLVAVMVVVGLAAGVIGASITGNYLVVTDQSTFQNRYTYSAAEADRTFATKTEVESIKTGLNEIENGLERGEFNIQVLDMFGKCKIMRTGNSDKNGNYMCNIKGNKCVLGQVHSAVYVSDLNLNSKDLSLVESILDCNETADDLINQMITGSSTYSLPYVGGIDTDTSWLCCSP